MTRRDASTSYGISSACSNCGGFGMRPYALSIPMPAISQTQAGGALSDLDMKTIGELAPTLFADRQARSGLMAPWANGKNGKEYRATLGQKAIAGIFSVGLEEKYRWKDSVQSGDEIRLWVADGIAQDLRPWFVKFNAKPIDRRWLPVVQEIYEWHHAHQDYLRNERPLARVAMVYSQQTASFYGGEDARAKVEEPALGFYQALVEARIPFEMVHDHLLDPAHINRFKTLILPNIAALSTSQCDQLRAFVAQGGSLVATYETSLYDEWGDRRADFGLADLFGTSFTGKEEGPLQNSYLSLEMNGGQVHPLLKGLEGATRIVNGAHSVSVTTLANKDASPLIAVPSYPDLPMEEVFTRPTKTRQPGVLVREAGKGRVVYFPADIDRTFWEVLGVDLAVLLRNAVQWATNEPAPVTAEGKGVVDLSIWEQKHSMTVAPGEPDESHDDEGTRQRDHPAWGTGGNAASSRRPAYHARASIWSLGALCHCGVMARPFGSRFHRLAYTRWSHWTLPHR